MTVFPYDQEQGKMPTLATSVQHCTGGSSQSRQARKWNLKKNTHTGKAEANLFLLAYDMTFYTKNPKEPTKNLLELINRFGKVAGYVINIQKSVAFLYTCKEHSKINEINLLGKLGKFSHL